MQYFVFLTLNIKFQGN